MSDRTTPPTADTHLDRLCARVAPLVREPVRDTFRLIQEGEVVFEEAGESEIIGAVSEGTPLSCQAGFAERVIQVAQIVLLKPRCQRAPILGELQDTIPVVP